MIYNPNYVLVNVLKREKGRERERLREGKRGRGKHTQREGEREGGKEKERDLMCLGKCGDDNEFECGSC